MPSIFSCSLSPFKSTAAAWPHTHPFCSLLLVFAWRSDLKTDSVSKILLLLQGSISPNFTVVLCIVTLSIRRYMLNCCMQILFRFFKNSNSMLIVIISKCICPHHPIPESSPTKNEIKGKWINKQNCSDCWPSCQQMWHELHESVFQLETWAQPRVCLHH